MARGKKTGGRRRGSLNKTTLSVKAALIEAFEEMGGVAALVRWGKKNPSQFYALWGRLLPQEVKSELSGPEGGPIQHEFIDTLTPDDIFAARRLVGMAGGDLPPNGGPQSVDP